VSLASMNACSSLLARCSSANPAAPVRGIGVKLGGKAEDLENFGSGESVEDCFEERRRFRGPWDVGEGTDLSSSAVGALDVEEEARESAMDVYDFFFYDAAVLRE